MKKLLTLSLIVILMKVKLFSQKNQLNVIQQDTATINLIIDFGKTYLGKKYKYGGCNSSTGFDCSGFIHYIHKMAGYKLPRRSSEIGLIGESVDLTEIKKGDLLFFNTLSNGKISHVGIVSAVSKEKVFMLHVSSSKGVQNIDFISSDYWYSRFVLAKRFF